MFAQYYRQTRLVVSAHSCDLIRQPYGPAQRGTNKRTPEANGDTRAHQLSPTPIGLLPLLRSHKLGIKSNVIVDRRVIAQ